ncbi:MAG: universal stress protein [Bacteroidota bacterium]|jgi:nucleotide-binding universal stress UspA family protein
MKKILVPVDFSEHTEITCMYALELAATYGAELKLFHTYFDQIILTDTTFPDTLDMTTLYNEQLMREIFKQAEAGMKELQEKMETRTKEKNLANVTITSHVSGGEVEYELLEIYNDFKPDMIVIGTTGKGNNLNVWGKVSTFIIDHVKVPVFTIPVMKNFKGFENVMFAADLSDGNHQSITTLIDIFKPFNNQVHTVHFCTPLKAAEANAKMKKLQSGFEKETAEGKIHFNVIEVEGENQDTIDQFVKGKLINLIAFQPHKHSLVYMVFTRNITKKNLFATNVPLLALPVGKS